MAKKKGDPGDTVATWGEDPTIPHAEPTSLDGATPDNLPVESVSLDGAASFNPPDKPAGPEPAAEVLQICPKCSTSTGVVRCVRRKGSAIVECPRKCGFTYQDHGPMVRALNGGRLRRPVGQQVERSAR